MLNFTALDTLLNVSSSSSTGEVMLGGNGGEEEGDDCLYTPPLYLTERFWLVTALGSSVAIVSVVENVLLFFMLARKPQHRNSHCLYLLLLAFFDIFMGAAYMPLMSVSLLLDYLQSVRLLRAWYTYMTPLITTSHMAMTSSSFLILAASFERFCLTCAKAPRMKLVMKYRRLIAGAAILWGVLTKCTLAAEFTIDFNPECVGTMNEYSLRLSALALDHYYNLIWRFGFRNVLTVLFPFFLLLVINTKIVLVLQEGGGSSVQMSPSQATQIVANGLPPLPMNGTSQGTTTSPTGKRKLDSVERKKRVRAATRTLVLIVLTYLLANVLNVVLTFWEYVDMDSLMVDHVAFYTFSVDTVSILTIVAGALRLPIYITCMPQLRRDFFTFMRELKSGSWGKSPKRHAKPNPMGVASLFMLLRVTEGIITHLPDTGAASESDYETDYDNDDDDDDGFDEVESDKLVGTNGGELSHGSEVLL